MIIWTTTPWTIPANLGISVHPDLNLCVVNVNGQKYLVAEALLEDSSKNDLNGKIHEVIQNSKRERT